ncbi:MAG: VapC toxin family PIN domain ribonuclease [Opitutia bacterium]|nr:type II toxin-antitoxin system VapC family toxin [Opitutaceae bacterium]PHX84761.1 MAG: VapC toxin family PIN domain ribonuclease [Opitutae bacterium]
MADLILPDSNIYIGAVRAGRDPFREFAAGIDDRDWEFATCGMIVLEVCRGQRDPNLLGRYRERFDVMIFLPTTRQIWARAAQLAWSLDRQRRVLPAQDILIAAHALQAGATVLTLDAHFSDIPGLRVIHRLS